MVYRSNGGNVVVYNNRPEAEGAAAELAAATSKGPELFLYRYRVPVPVTEPSGVGFRADHGSFSYSRRTASSMSASATWFQRIEPQWSHRPIGTSARQKM